MSALLQELRQRLEAAADPARAPVMQAYMKSAMPYHGVPAAPLRAICKSLFADLAFADSAAWAREVRGLWRGAQFREERHAAIELTGIRAVRPFQRFAALPLYEEMIVTGAWWDFVDTIATRRLGILLANDREPMRRAMLDWSTDRDMWKRRSAILCQLHAKGDTDVELLMACIEPSLASREFFLRKAIGWALRHYARTDANWVAYYVARMGDRLSPLSRREAMKHIG